MAKKFFEVEMDKVRGFRFGVLAQKRIEEKYQCQYTKIDFMNFTVEDNMFLLWSALKETDRQEIGTLENFITLIDGYMSIAEAYKLINIITADGFGKNEEPPEEMNPAEMTENTQNGTGTEQYPTL